MGDPTLGTGTSACTKTKFIREMRFHLHDSARRKSSESFRKIKEAIVNKVNSSFDNPIEIGESLKTGIKFVFEKPEIETNYDDEAGIRAQENLMFLEEYKINFTIFGQSEIKFKEQWIKAYALIWGSYCSREMCMAIKEMPEFESVIRNDPLATLSRVEILMHTPERARYPSLNLIEVLLVWLNTKQGADEDLLDYLSRFRSERDVVMRLYDGRLIDGFVGRLPSFISLSNVEREELKKRELNKFEASLFLQNAGDDWYGDFLVEYRKAFANKECRYPSSVSNMVDVMRQQPKKNKDPSKEEKLNDTDQGLLESSFIQTGGYACYCCGKSTCWFHHC